MHAHVDRLLLSSLLCKELESRDVFKKASAIQQRQHQESPNPNLSVKTKAITGEYTREEGQRAILK